MRAAMTKEIFIKKTGKMVQVRPTDSCIACGCTTYYSYLRAIACGCIVCSFTQLPLFTCLASNHIGCSSQGQITDHCVAHRTHVAVTASMGAHNTHAALQR